MSEETSSDPCKHLDFPECHIAVILWRIFAPTFIFVGISGNVMSIVVLSRRRMCSTTTSVHLRLLAVIDSMVLLCGVLRECISNYLFIDIRMLSDLSCKIHTWVSYNVAGLSCWFLSFIAIDRLISIKFPLWAKTHCSRKLAAIIGMSLIVTVSLIDSHMLWVLYKENVYIYSNISNSTILLEVKCSASSPEYAIFLNQFWPALVLLLYSIIPILCLISCNIMLFRHLSVRVIKRQARKTIGIGKKQDRKDFRSLTKMLVVVCLFFIIISVPVCLYLVVEPYLFDSTSPHSIAKRKLTFAVVKVFLYCNNTFNFVLYCLSGSLFRKELIEIVWQLKIYMLKWINRRIHPIQNLNEMIEDHKTVDYNTNTANVFSTVTTVTHKKEETRLNIT